MTLRSAVLLLLAVSFTACAWAPPAAPPPKPAPAAAQFPTIDLLCAEGARYVSFDKLSVPGGESPVDVALTRGSIWVLFPRRLVQIGRGGDHVSVRMQLAPSEEAWAKLDVDPVDESVWVASQSRPVLYKITPDGKTMSIVKLPKIEGKGGFSGLVVARDAIYAQPTCADAAVWRVDRTGKVLGTAFPAPKPAEGEPEVLQAGKPRWIASPCASIATRRVSSSPGISKTERPSRSTARAPGRRATRTSSITCPEKPRP